MPRFALWIGCVALIAPLAILQGTALRAATPEKTSARQQITSLPHLAPALTSALEDRRFAEAIQLIDGELKKPDVAADYLLYLRGRAQTELKLYDQAIETFRNLETRSPKGNWAARARFGRAEVLIRQRNYQQAGEIYELEATRLLSAGRRDELAAIYLEFADRFFDGTPSASHPGTIDRDYQHAAEFYQQAQSLHPSLEKEQQIALRIARCEQELHQLEAAIQAFRKFLADYGSEADTKRRAPIALEIEARYRLGLVQLAANQPAEARKTWQDLLDGPAFRLTQSPLLAEAQFQLSRTYGIPDPATEGDLELGVAALESFLKANPKHRLAPEAELDIAMGYGARGRYEPAGARLRSLIDNPAYAASDELPQARNLLGELLFTQKKYNEAIGVWRAFLTAHPNHHGWTHVLARITDAEFAKAQEQFRLKNYSAAGELWETFLKDHPLDERAPKVLYLFGKMKYEEGVDRVNARVAEAARSGKPVESLDATARQFFEQAIEEWKRLASKYPQAEDPTPAVVNELIGEVLEQRLSRLNDAIDAYKKSGSDEAAKRLARLTERQMEILTPRKFRTSEHPYLRLSTRNVDKVTVKVYRVEMTDYFRKMHLASAIETLDIGLIDPDKTFDFAVAGYEKLRPFENSVTLPVEGPGVWAVTVSSEKLEATTMVIVSDLDVIAKCSRNELFVFAENVADRKPAPGTKLLISDGSRIFAEEQTDKEGILQKSYDQLKTVADLRIFAVREGHIASTVNALEGLDFAVGLTPIGQIYTDRPAYRAGELVNLKGIVRWVADDRFTFKEGEAYQLEISDPRGRTIQTAQVKLNRFGTFATSFLLPDAVPQGTCSVRLFQPDGKQSYTSNFEVHEAKLEQIRLEVELPRKVYYRGEKIEGKIRLRYYYGTPLAGREIQYQLADDRLHTGTTNAAGELAFEFPTRRYSESQALQLVVLAPEHNLRTIERVFLAARGFDIRVSTVRKVYLGGETFDANVTVTDPADKPVGVPLKLEILEKVTADGKSGERLVESHDIQSDKETGKARRTIHIDKSGRFLLRATAVDRFGTPVSGAIEVMISGDDDTTRLRILADQHNYQAGDAARVNLHWREAPALALVTYEGASILGHKLVELKTGANPFDFAIEPRLAPNFVLAVAVIDRTQLHGAFSDFSVERKLTIALKPNSATPKPGSQLTVDITATDPQGKPVAVELSLGMVQRNLLDLFAASGGSLDKLFVGTERKPSMRTMASCTFLYQPKTHGISEALLAEEDRGATAAREKAANGSLDFGFAIGNGVDTDTDGLPDVARGETDAAVSTYQLLMRAGRYTEAEQLARQAKQAQPGNPTVELMVERARIARTITKNGQDGVSDPLSQNSMIENLFEGDEPEEIARDWRSIQSRGIQFQDRAMAMGGGMGGGGMPAQPSQNMDRLKVLKEGGDAPDANYSGTQGRPSQGERKRTWSQKTIDESFIAGAKKDRESAEESMRGLNRQSSQQAANRSRKRISGAQVFGNSGLGKFGSPVFDNSMSMSSSDSKQFPDLLNRPNSPSPSTWGFSQNGFGETRPLDARAAAGANLKSGLRFFTEAMLGETGYWNPAIVTGKDGKARVTFRLPERSTAWRLRAAGIDAEALAGEADADLVAKKDFFGEMKLPGAFTAGDRADIPVDVQNASVESGVPIEVRLKVTLNDRTTELKKSLVSRGPGIESLVFPATFGEAGTAQFELTVASGDHRDVTRAAIPVRADGLPVFSSTSGTAGQSTIALVDADPRLAIEHPRLEILIGPSVDRTLLDAILGSGPSLRGCDDVLPTNSLERATSDVLGGVALLAMIRTSRSTDTPEATALAVRVRAAVAQLVGAQRNDGSWSWSGGKHANASDRFLSSRAAWAMSAARRGGFAVPSDAFDRATTFLSSALVNADLSQRDVQATLFHALSECGKGDFAIGNRLYRERNRLSNSALLHVALGLARLDRKEMAGELLNLVKVDIDPAAAGRHDKELLDAKAAPALRSGVELRALYLLATEEIQPTSDKGAKLADWLLAARQGSRWRPDKANGPAVAALARWFRQVKPSNEKYTLTVFVNDHRLETLAVNPSTDASRRLEVPASMLVQGRPQRINFDMEGRGRFSYSAILSGFVPSARLAATTDDWFVQRWYERAQRMLDGEPVPRGFDVVAGSYTFFRNDLTQLPVGTRGEVTLSVSRRRVRGTADEQLDYLVITEPLPAGASVLADSVRGSFERYEVSPGTITFYVGDAPYPGELHYTLVGYVPGAFHAAPTVARSFYQPQRIAVSTRKTFDVLPRGTATHDVYKLTPRELFYLGKRLVGKGQFAEGADYLTRLVKQYHLQDTIYHETVQALFQAALATGQNPSIVEYFEIIKEKLPDIEIDFPSILRVALAYRALGEYERSFLVYRATLEAAFQRETQIAGFLDDRNQFLRSVQVMERLLGDYPAEAYVATATYSLAQEVYGKAPAAAKSEELLHAGMTRVDLIAASVEMLDHFLATWPNDPAADQATFSTVSAFLDLENYEAAIGRCRRAVARYPDSPLADSFWYVIGYSQYELGQSDAALTTCRKVAEMTHKDPHTGQTVPAENKWQAVYIEGQIFHSLGKPAEALAEYEQVKDRFPDAKEAIDFFVHRRLTLPEIVTLRPNEAPKITLSYRNIPRVDLKVYRVDLLKFGLLQRNLAKITAINLAGIRPYHELSLALGDGKDYRDREKSVPLPLKEEGAYLVVCRGDDDYASGLVLVSPLELAVQEDIASGRVRVTAKDAVADSYVSKVLVKVIGSGNSDFVTGETDLRGIFKADAIRGETTVIARAQANRYAFFRGTKVLAQAAEAPAPPDAAKQQAPTQQSGQSLLENLDRNKNELQQQQRDSYRSLLRNRVRGVKAQGAF